MDQEALTKEQVNQAVNLIAMMSVSELARRMHKKPTQMLLDFMKSRTAEALFDMETRLWCDGPLAVEHAYLEEISVSRSEFPS